MFHFSVVPDPAAPTKDRAEHERRVLLVAQTKAEARDIWRSMGGPENVVPHGLGQGTLAANFDVILLIDVRWQPTVQDTPLFATPTNQRAHERRQARAEEERERIEGAIEALRNRLAPGGVMVELRSEETSRRLET